MAKITVQVGSGAARYRIAVQAGSVRRALEIAEGLSPGSDFGTTFPAGFETCSGEGCVNTVESVEREKSAA